MDTVELHTGEVVLLVWGGNATDNIQQCVQTLSQRVGPTGSVQVENLAILKQSSHPESSFDAIISNLLPSHVHHSTDILEEMCRILRPNGTICLQEFVTDIATNQNGISTTDQLTSKLKLSGFITISEPTPVPLSDDDKSALNQANPVDAIFVQVRARKPGYEIGSASQLLLPFAASAQVADDVKQAWSLSAADMMDDGVEIINSDDLLDADDLKKPDPASLRASCGGDQKKRKACKNCTCGLAEEYEGDVVIKDQTAASACGSCYLGDAFRCASCPYLGMPAFKPGEKISLSDRQLKADS